MREAIGGRDEGRASIHSIRESGPEFHNRHDGVDVAVHGHGA